MDPGEEEDFVYLYSLQAPKILHFNASFNVATGGFAFSIRQLINN